MPFATFTRVREVSSEDNVHLAENLIKSQPGKKWKTKNAGEKSAYVILEMSESQQIVGIDIGNEHSAFIEVLVGKSSSAPEEFTDILITCSFMTPPESKNSTNTNRVRCFNQEALELTSVDKKWSLVKIVCTQPFNRHVQYGLSFIKVHVTQNQSLKIPTLSKNLVPEQFLNKLSESKYAKLSPYSIGKLKFREDSPESESESCSSLFNRWKKTKDNQSEPTTAACIRLASRSPMTTVQRRPSEVLSDTPPVKLIEKDAQILDRNRDNLMFGDDNDDIEDDIHKANPAKRDRLTKQIEADKERRRIELQKQEDKQKCKSLDASQSVKNTEKMQNKTENISLEKAYLPSTSKTITVSSSDKETNIERTKKRKSSPTERPKKRVKTSVDSKKYKPFNQLLKGVVLVISGIQNPDRGDLRNKAIALGAKYKGDWDNTCTHLICAFKNTPKYNQVKGEGKIVTRSWIEKCFSLKKYLPWRRYALDSNELTKPESDDEILDASLQCQQDENSNDADVKTTTTRRESEDRNNTLALYDIDDQPNSNKMSNKNSESHSDSDTDDEIQRIEQQNETKKTKPMPIKEQDIYEVSTDEEEYLQNKLTQLDSLNFFNVLKFFICEDINVVDKIKLEKLIEQYAGRVTNILSEAQYAVTNQGLDSCGSTFSGEVVRPLWIYECNILQAKLPTNRYLI